MASKYKELLKITSKTMELWKKSWGIAPPSVSGKLDKAMLDWNLELTEALSIWIDKGLTMTKGELILARVNLGNIVEFWLKFFYSVYYEDYLQKPEIRKNKTIEPESLTFEQLKNYSVGILWDNDSCDGFKRVHSVQKKRNAIYSFSYRDIGSSSDFLNDVDALADFVQSVVDRLPPLEGCILDANSY